MPDFSSLIIGSTDFAPLQEAIKMDERRKERQYQIGRQQKAEKATATGFLQNTVDSKQFLTGGDLDPVIIANLKEAEKKGLELVEQGADSSQIYQALSPIIQNVTKYKAASKQINAQIDESMKYLKQNGGGNAYDYAKLAEAARQKAFYSDGKLNPDGVDTSRNYVMDVIQDTPEAVTSAAGIADFVNKDKSMIEEDLDVTEYDNVGNMNRNRIKSKRPGWMAPEYTVDEKTKEKIFTGFAPKYDEAVDEQEQAVVANFPDGKGGIVKGPVRLLDEGLYDQINKENPGIADWLRGQVNVALKEHKEATGEDISIRSDKAKVIARGLLYTELAGRGKQMSSRTIVDSKPGAAMAGYEAQKANAPFIIQLAGDKAGAAQTARQQALMDPEYAEFVRQQDLAKKENTQTAKGTTDAEAKKVVEDQKKSDDWRKNDSVGGATYTNRIYQGKTVDGQTIRKVDSNPVTGKLWNKKFSVTLEDADGKEVKKEFDTKGELFKFLDKAQGGTVPAAAKPASSTESLLNDPKYFPKKK